jgi:hypothetical protein
MARRFSAIIARDNVDTGDGRRFPSGAFTWRTPPLSVMAQTQTPEFGGHGLAFILGRMDTITRDGDMIVARGELADEGEGEEADRRRDTIGLIERGDLNGVSVDPAGVEVHYECLEFDEEEGWCVSEIMVFDSYVIGAATVVNIPAIEGTLITLDPDESAAVDDEPDEEDAVAASAAATLDRPPADWFTEPADLPDLDAPGSRLPVVTDEGRVFGYLCSWDDCHISFPNYCQTPWRSPTGYAYARVNATEAATAAGEGQQVAVAALAVQGGHFPTTGEHARNWRAAQAHYDDPDTCAAYVAVGENDHGVWFSGALRPTTTPEQVATLRRHQLSGDWRRIGGAMELVGMCSVNVPGFVREVAMAASGAPGTDMAMEPVAAVIGGNAVAASGACCDSCAASGSSCSHTAATSARSLTATAIDGRVRTTEEQLAMLLDVLGPEVRDRLRARMRA